MGKRRSWFVRTAWGPPGGVGYPSKKRAKRVAKIAGGKDAKVDGPRSPLRWLLILAAIIAVIAGVVGAAMGWGYEG